MILMCFFLMFSVFSFYAQCLTSRVCFTLTAISGWTGHISGAPQLAAIWENVILEGKLEQWVETCGIQTHPWYKEKRYDDPSCLRRGWAPRRLRVLGPWMGTRRGWLC